MSDITANVVVSMPNQLFTLARSFKAASGGKIYIGQIDTDPVNPANQIQVYLENEDGSHVPVAQPIIINAAGYPVYNGQIAKFVTVQGHSMAVYDMYGTQQFYYPNILKYDPDQFAQRLADQDGLKYVGRCESIAKLRTIKPTKPMQLIDVAEYTVGGKIGGGYFVYDSTDTTSADDGGSIIVTTTGERWKRRVEQLLPVHFGAVPGATSEFDATDALKRYIAASSGKTVDLRNGPWRIKGTLDFTNVRQLITDTSGKLWVNPSQFTGANTTPYVVTFGNPDLPYGSGRCVSLTLTGLLIIEADNRTTSLNGVYIKGALLNFGHIRIVKFNGRGIHRQAVWDSTFQRFSVEQCGNASNYAYYSESGGDTDNTNHVLSLQVEQSYNKAIYMTGIRDVVHNIHCERTYITTTEAGDTTTAGLNYITCSFGLGNSFIGQGVIDAATDATAPDGTPTVSTVASVVFAMDFSSVHNIATTGGVISIGFGRSVVYTGFVCGGLYVAEPAAKITLNSPRVTGTLQCGSEVIINSPDIATFRPRANALGIQINGGVITSLLFNNNYRGNITFNNVNITNPIGDLRAPTGSGSNTSIGGLYAPTAFNNCTIGTVNGEFGSRGVFNGGRIAAVSLASQCAFEFYNVNIGTFTFTGNRAFITRGVKADTVTTWNYPAHYIWPAGTITERIGAIPSGTGVVYVNRDGTATNWTAISST
ncbi:phage tailspike protein [Klebsiella aerogenes]